jgi:PAS domain S-box-containing protein
MTDEGLTGDVEDVIITSELDRRPSRTPDYEAESKALARLAGELADRPETILQCLTDLIVELGVADSAGISIQERREGDDVFEWAALSGAWAGFRGGTIPFDASPCGVVVSQNQTLLFEHPERIFPDANVEPPICEILLVPFHARGRPIGTLWINAHNPHRKFDREDARLLTSLSRFAAAGWQTNQALAAARAGEQAIEQRSRLIVENATDYAIFTLDLEGRISDWLPGAEQVFGWTAAEMAGQPFQITFLDEDRAAGAPERELEQARREGTAPDVRWHQRKGGNRVFIDGINTAIRDHQGRIHGFLKVGQDVTARRAAEEALRQGEERFRQFAEASSDVLWIADAETRQLEFLSPAYEKVWGEPRDAVMSDLSHWSARLHPEDVDQVGEGIGRLLRGERYVAEYRIIRPDGSIRFIQDAGFPIVVDGKVARVAGVAQDLTDRRMAERALAESERRLRSLVEGVPQLVWRSFSGGRWTWASPQWSAYTGQSDPESLELGWLEAVHPDDREAAMRAWAAAELTGGFEVEFRVRCAADGAYRWFQTRATPVRNSAGTIEEWLGTSNDIDDLRRLQRHQQTLLGELQHRVRNTLGVVRSIARRTAELSETKDELADHLQGRLAAFARVQSAVTRTPAGGVDLAALIEDELVAHAARESETVTVDGPDVNLTPRTAESLSLAIHELATNAVKYGALSRADATLSVSWQVEQRDGAAWLRLVWEEGGMDLPSNEPSRRGFGMELLERSLPYELDAVTRAEFRPTGFMFNMELPLATLVVE